VVAPSSSIGNSGCACCATLVLSRRNGCRDLLRQASQGVGSRYSVGQLRLRIVDASRVNPQTIMPPYYRTEGLLRLAPAFAGKSILNADQVEDVVAFLSTLKEE